jgi:hypothetical protein
MIEPRARKELPRLEEFVFASYTELQRYDFFQYTLWSSISWIGSVMA